MASLSYVIFVIFVVFTISSSAPVPATRIHGVLTIPDECQRPGFCAIKPEGYDQLEEKINSVLPDFLRKIG